jgi:HPt (histidine-containing phosphotransfer) domain-containing protein
MDVAHKIKGGAGYVGASRLHYAAYFMQDHYLKGRLDDMMSYYPTLIEAAIEFKIYSVKVMTMLKKKQQEDNFNYKEMPVATGYRVEFEDGEYYALY